MTSLPARALLFDMDGTLVDSLEIVSRMWGVYADRFGFDLDELLRESHGVRMADTITRLTPDADLDELVRELSGIELADPDGVVPIAGAPELLAALPASSFAVVTSASRELAQLRLDICGLPFPAASVTAEEVTRGKPDPQGYLLGAERLGADPADTIVFEDAEAGIRAGLSAGMRVVVVGGHESETTRGLPRLRDYRGVTVTVDDGRVVLEGKFT